MNYSEVADLSAAELTRRIKETRAEMFEARMKNALGQLTNPMVLRQGRRNVARLQTALASKAAATPAVAKTAVAAPKAKKKTTKARGSK